MALRWRQRLAAAGRIVGSTADEDDDDPWDRMERFRDRMHDGGLACPAAAAKRSAVMGGGAPGVRRPTGRRLPTKRDPARRVTAVSSTS
jgi:hypothetical protein